MAVLTVGMIIISLVLSYAWWCKVRVLRLKNFFYDLRDELDSTAEKLGAIDDPAYQWYREHLSMNADTAEDLSVALIAYALARGVRPGTDEKTENVDLQKAIDDASNRVTDRLYRYLFSEMATGYIFVFQAVAMRLRHEFERQMRSWLFRWFVSNSRVTFK